MLPTSLSPQLCTLVPDVPDGAEWLHEIKYDGWRLLARKDGSDVRLYTRGGVEWSARLPKLADAVRQLPVRSAWLDGEIVHLDAKGYPQFERVMPCVRTSNEAAIFYHVWDLPWLDGRSLTDQPLLERKAVLSEICEQSSGRIRFTSHVVGQGPAFFRAVDTHDLEGIVAKRAASRYHAGQRTRDWLKVKCWRTYNLLVGGVERDGEGRLSALLVGSPEGGRLRYEGRVEFGLHRVRQVWDAKPPAVACPFREKLRDDRRTWLEPRFAIEVRALPRSGSGGLRHATAVGKSAP